MSAQRLGRMLVAAIGLLLLLLPAPLAVAGKIGVRVVGGMRIEATLEEAEPLQVLVGGRAKILSRGQTSTPTSR